jgi:hypothetical protein
MIDNLRLSGAADALGAPEAAGAPKDTAVNGRASNGQFGPHNTFARGNPANRKLAAARRLVMDAVSDDELVALVRKMYQDAVAGDAAARQLLLAYLVGRPGKVVNPDRVDLDELALIAESPLPVDLLRQFCGRVEAGLAVQKATQTQAVTREDLDARIDRETNALRAELATLRAKMARLRGHDLDDLDDDDLDDLDGDGDDHGPGDAA